MNILKNKQRPSLGQHIYDLRMQHDITQEELCKKLSVTRRTITYYELEAKKIPLDFAQKLARAFNVEIKTFLNGKHHEPESKPVNALPKKLKRFLELPKEDQRYVIRTIDALADKSKKT